MEPEVPPEMGPDTRNGELLRLPSPLTWYIQTGAVTRERVREAATLRYMCEAGLEPMVFDDEVRDAGSDFVGSPEAALEVLAQACPEEMRSYICHMPMPSTVVTEGCRVFAGYVSEREGRVPRWVAAAFWWLSYAVDGRFSADELSAAIIRCHAPWLLRDWDRLLEPS